MWFQVFLFVASLVIGELLRPKPKGPEDAKAAGIENVQYPTAQEGRPIPVVWGTVQIKGPNLLWYGDYRPLPIIKTYKVKKLFSSKKKSYVSGYKYHIGLHLGLCHGEIDALLKIQFQDKTAWEGHTASGEILVNQTELFGGEDKSGGVAAKVRIYSGSTDQSIDSYLQQHIDLVPGYRGLTHIVWQGPSAGFVSGLTTSGYIGTQPNIQPMRFIVKRLPKALNSRRHDINGDANPAEMLYEILTNDDWGMGLPRNHIEKNSFLTAATILANEQFGLSMQWDSVSSIENILDEILRHIDGEIFMDVNTGQYVLTLARDNQPPKQAVLFNPSNVIRLDSYQRSAWDETTNEVKVTYMDRTKDFKPGTALAQDLANFYRQNGIVSKQISYPGVTQGELASRLAMRDLKALSLPLVKVKLVVNRHAYQLRPGDVIRWDWPDLGVKNMLLRIVKIQYGDLLNGEITLNAVQDVFSLPDTVYSTPQPSGWQDPIQPPKPIIHQRVIEAPYFILATHPDVDDSETARLITLAARPSGSPFSYKVIANSEEVAEIGTFTPTAILKQDYPKETDYFDQSNQLIITAGIDIGFVQSTRYDDVVNNATNLALLGDEFISFTDIKDNGDGTHTLNGVLRGILDTVPQDHSADKRIWFLSYGFGLLDDEYQLGDRIGLKYLPVTSKGTLPQNQATALNIQIQDRAKKPYPPGDVKINGQSWPTEITGDIEITWAHRNRTTQLTLFSQKTHNIAPEDGVRYTVRIFGDNIQLKHTETALTETRFVYDQEMEKAENFGKLNQNYRVEIVAEKNTREFSRKQIKSLNRIKMII